MSGATKTPHRTAYSIGPHQPLIVSGSEIRLIPRVLLLDNVIWTHHGFQIRIRWDRVWNFASQQLKNQTSYNHWYLENRYTCTNRNSWGLSWSRKIYLCKPKCSLFVEGSHKLLSSSNLTKLEAIGGTGEFWLVPSKIIFMYHEVFLDQTELKELNFNSKDNHTKIEKSVQFVSKKLRHDIESKIIFAGVFLWTKWSSYYFVDSDLYHQSFRIFPDLSSKIQLLLLL